MKIQSENTPKKKEFKRRGLWYDAWIRLRKNKSAVIGMIMLGGIFIACFGAPLYIDYDTQVIGLDYANMLKFPVKGHLLGTDEIGRDILARIIWGGKISLTVGIQSVMISFAIGGSLGAIAGYYGNLADTLIMRMLDIFMAIPSMLLMITLASIMEPTVANLTIAVSVGFIPGTARMIRAQVLRLSEQEFIEAVKAQGASDFRIIVFHIMPNAISPLISQFIMNIAGAIMSISGLSFIGLGVQAPNPEWGAMLASGRTYFRDTSHITIFPGLAILITIIALTLAGDGLRDALDPKMKS